MFCKTDRGGEHEIQIGDVFDSVVGEFKITYISENGTPIGRYLDQSHEGIILSISPFTLEHSNLISTNKNEDRQADDSSEDNNQAD